MAADLDETLRRCTETARSPAGYRRALEDLLSDVSEDTSDALMMLMKESRGAWGVFLGAGAGRLLFCGNALSGSVVALATLGFDVVVVDRSEERLRWSAERSKDLTPGRAHFLLGGTSALLPFVDGAFDVCVQEDGLPSAATDWGHDLEELRRCARHEILVTSDNRLGYKRSTGRRGAFRRDPRVFISEVVRPSRGERTLPGTRSAVRGPWEHSTAYSLYPHAREFSHIVALDARRPRLTIGPREKTNHLKMWGKRAGLFRWMTPSFAVQASRGRVHKRRIERILEGVAAHLEVETPTLDIAVATRSNNVLVLTDRARPDEDGSWAIHIALQPCKLQMVRSHFDWLTKIRASFPGVPVPEPLFAGVVDGVDLAVARRIGGLSGTEVTGDRPRTARMIAGVTAILKDLVEPNTTELTDELFEQLVGDRVRLVLEHVRTAPTRRDLEERMARLRQALLGRKLRLATYHADMRSKHVRVSPDGDVLGILDWGASEARFLPLADLLQLIVHQRKQESGAPFGSAWRTLCDPKNRVTYETEALERYAEHVGLEASDVDVLLDAFPLFVAGMAERNWDFSRPHWVARQFGI